MHDNQHQRAKRDCLFMLVDLTVADNSVPHRARLRNLSATGAMTECRAAVALDDRVAIKLRGIGTVNGSVSWVSEGRIGISFDQAIDPQAVRRSVGSDREIAVVTPKPASLVIFD